MAKPSPYRSLSTDQRVALVTHAIKSTRELRELYIQRLASRPGGFRIVTLRSWSPDQLAKAFVRTNAQTVADEFDLMHRLYVEVEPGIQKTFLDAAGVSNDNGQMPDDLQPPFADEAAVKKGAEAVRAAHGEDGERYLRTLARYSPDGWPGVDAIAAELE